MAFAKTSAVRCFQFGDNCPLHECPPHRLANIQHLSNAEGIQVQTGMRGLFESRLERYLELSLYFQSPFLRVVIDDADYYPASSEVQAILANCLPSFRKAGVVLAIENHDRFSYRTMLQWIEKNGEGLGVCLDTANSLGCNEGIGEIAGPLAPHTVNLHVKDILIRRVPTKMGFEIEGAPAGKGMIDLRGIVELLEVQGKCNTATLELWSKELESPQATIEREIRWVLESLDYLQRILQRDEPLQ